MPLARSSKLRRWRRVLGALMAVGLAALAVLLYRPDVSGGSPAIAPVTTPAPTEIAGAGRGRTTGTQAPVARATPTQVPVPATPAPFPLASGVPGIGGGTGTGIFGPPPPKPSDDRFIFTVRDAQTLQVLPGVCVTYGQSECRPDRSTNPQGLWWVDFPRGAVVAPDWLFYFKKDGYEALTKKVEYTPGGQVTVEILLQRKP